MTKQKTQLSIREFFNSDKGRRFLGIDAEKNNSNQLSDNNPRHYKATKKIWYVGGG